LTPRGRLKAIKRAILKEWDGYWRIITFDIEEKRKKTRDAFRTKLRLLNCKPIQKSVWITPNDIAYDLEEIIDILDLKNNVDYFLSKALSNEEKYLEMFDIKKVSNNKV
jgi:DNA-binding transcriptional regulator PaaX